MFTTRFGGIEQVFLDYNQVFKDHNIEVSSLIHKNSQIPLGQEKLNHKINNFSKYDPLALLKIYLYVKKVQPDVIITHGNRAHYMLKKVAGNVPVIGVSHNYSFKHIVNCDRVIVITQDMMSHLVDYGYSADKIFHIPNMLNVPPNASYTIPQFRKVAIIGLLARIEKIKGVDTFIRSLDLLKQKKIPFQAKIGGDGPEYHNIKSMISNLNLENDVEMLGWISDREKFYESVDILCMPSRAETFGLVILESFVYSKPLIISNLPGPMEVVDHGKCALTFENGDYSELASKIELFLKDQNLAQEFAFKGYQRAQEFSQHKVGKLLVERLKTICYQ